MDRAKIYIRDGKYIWNYWKLDIIDLIIINPYHNNRL